MKNRKSNLDDFSGSQLSGTQKKMIIGGTSEPIDGDPPISSPPGPKPQP